MNVLSLFDGVSCARIALDKMGIKITSYLASEIDKYAIKIQMANYPDTIQLGDGLNVSVRKGGVYVYDKRVGPVPDFLSAGSPCQGFSKAGKGLNFEDPRSILFFEFARILSECKKYNPKIKFFLENVDMKREWRNVITKHVGAQPIFIDSQVLCAQQRQRWYWQNFIPKDKLYEVLYPKNRGLVIHDILEEGPVDEKYFLSEKMISRLKVKSVGSKAGCFTAGGHSGGHSGGLHSDMDVIEDKRMRLNYKDKDKDKDKANAVLSGSGRSTRANGSTVISQSQMVFEPNGKMEAITAKTTGGFDQKVIVHSGYGRTGGKKQGGTGPLFSEDGKSYAIDTGTGTNKIEVVGVINEFVFKANKANKANNIDANYFKGHDNHGARSVIQVNESKESGGVQPYQQNRVYDKEGIMPALNAELSGRNNIVEQRRIRRLTPIEVGRLQGMPDDYFFKDGKYIISETQVYKCCGNGWQVDTIVHMFQYL